MNGQETSQHTRCSIALVLVLLQLPSHVPEGNKLPYSLFWISFNRQRVEKKIVTGQGSAGLS